MGVNSIYNIFFISFHLFITFISFIYSIQTAADLLLLLFPGQTVFLWKQTGRKDGLVFEGAGGDRDGEMR